VSVACGFGRKPAGTQLIFVGYESGNASTAIITRNRLTDE
jgi:hypothetical protein